MIRIVGPDVLSIARRSAFLFALVVLANVLSDGLAAANARFGDSTADARTEYPTRDVETLERSLQNTSKASSTKKPAEPRGTSGVAWQTSYDKFKGFNFVALTLSGISAAVPKFEMLISCGWSSAQQENKPTGWTDGNSIDFISESSTGAARVPNNEGIFLLDGRRRIYFTGSNSCQDCKARKDNIADWILLDLINAKTVEGTLNGVTFALNAAQVAAIREYVETRQLIARADYLKKYQGKTSRETAVLLDQHLQANKEADIKVSRLSSEAFNFRLDLSPGYLSVETKPGDVRMWSPWRVGCKDGTQCVRKVTHYQGGNADEVETSELFGQYFDGDSGDMMGYIYYRMFYCDDGLYYP
jgi:hypothetical protein